MTFTREQVRSAKYHLQEAADSALIANWRNINNNEIADSYHAEWMIGSIKKAAAALGYVFEPAAITDKPGFDSRDDASIGMREANIT